MPNHPIIDKALEEGWPLAELIDVCEIFGYTIQVESRADVSPNGETESPGGAVEECGPEDYVERFDSLVEEYQRAPDRSRKRWTPMERFQLRNYFMLGVSPALAAEKLNRTPKAIRHQYRKFRNEKLEKDQNNA